MTKFQIVREDFKRQDTTNLMAIQLFDDNNLALTPNSSHTWQAKVVKGEKYAGEFSVNLRGNQIEVPAAQFAKLPSGEYGLELWETYDGKTTIYPSAGFVPFEIHRNAPEAAGVVDPTTNTQQLLQEMREAVKQIEFAEPIGVPAGNKPKVTQEIKNGKHIITLTLVQGERGPQGLQGIQGIQGPKGDRGDQGIQGKQGETGPRGPRGARAINYSGTINEQAILSGQLILPKSELGVESDVAVDDIMLNYQSLSDGVRISTWRITAIDGTNATLTLQGVHVVPQGPQGIVGPIGATGPVGPAGPQGPKGEKGDQGIQGEKGNTGPQGPQGIQGQKGDTGERGPQGLTAYEVAQQVGFSGSKEEWLESLKGGPKGPKGDRGSTIWPTSTTTQEAVTLDNLYNNSAFQWGDDHPAVKKGDFVYFVAEYALAIIKEVQEDYNVAIIDLNSISYLQGPRGERGPVGEPGPAGANGKDGAKGDTGSQGPAGPNGITPTIGTNGNWYLGDEDTGKPSRGTAGPTGPQGIQGPKGDQGDKGEQGKQGERGPQGLQGIQGPAGKDGAKGDTGERGPIGPQGERGLQGIKGDTGDQGPAGANGITPTIGDNGNWFLGDTDTGKPSRGATGSQGPAGEIGPQGPKGDTGDRGPTGAQGPQGDRGVAGANGITPSIGSNGNWYLGSSDTGKPSRGATGPTGPQGPAGKTPVRGTDYWTTADQDAIKKWVNDAILNGKW